MWDIDFSFLTFESISIKSSLTLLMTQTILLVITEVTLQRTSFLEEACLLYSVSLDAMFIYMRSYFPC